MAFDADQIAALKAKLDGSVVRKRVQAGRQLSYVEGWHVIAEANRIFGFDRWHRETLEMRQLGDPYKVEGKDTWRVAYMAKVKVEVFAGERAIIREGCGCGSGIDRDLGSAHESAIKEAETDAMKRALMTFGNPFGLALYDKEQNEVEHNGNGHATTPETARATAPLNVDALQDAIKSEIDHAADVRGVNAIMNRRGVSHPQQPPKPGSDLAKLKAADPASYDFLIDRAEKRAAYLMNKPGGKAA